MNIQPHACALLADFSRLPKGEALPCIAWLDLAESRLAPGALREYRTPLNEKRLAALQSIARERGVSVAALVLAWMACKPMDAVPIASVSSAAHLQELTESFDLALTAEEIERLDAGEAF